MAENENATIPATAVGHASPVDRGKAGSVPIAAVWPSNRRCAPAVEIEGCTNTPPRWPEHPNETVAVAVVSPDAGPEPTFYALSALF